MKIKINYDLIDKINIANRGYDLQKRVKLNVTFGAGLFIFNQAISEEKNILLHFVAYFTTCFFCIVFFSYLEKITGIIRYISEEELNSLIKQLRSIQINTNLEFLKEAKLVKKSYKLKRNDKNIPVIKQEKYIQIPIQNGLGEKFEETLFQEHIVGSKNYEISVKEPDEN